jgi:hypothetical protein
LPNDGVDNRQNTTLPESASLVAIYAGNSFTPSLDEAIQEGILGL